MNNILHIVIMSYEYEYIHMIILQPVQPAPTDVLSLDSFSGHFVGVDMLGFHQKAPLLPRWGFGGSIESFRNQELKAF